ncbi:hypothetical protein BDF19DRAFT_421794 [Syncephalis fuscata]|nr:hypothetical protein BDF19DRAFT_421794 [Syncephalis fuscata]
MSKVAGSTAAYTGGDPPAYTINPPAFLLSPAKSPRPIPFKATPSRKKSLPRTTTNKMADNPDRQKAELPVACKPESFAASRDIYLSIYDYLYGRRPCDDHTRVRHCELVYNLRRARIARLHRPSLCSRM